MMNWYGRNDRVIFIIKFLILLTFAFVRLFIVCYKFIKRMEETCRFGVRGIRYRIRHLVIKTGNQVFPSKEATTNISFIVLVCDASVCKMRERSEFYGCIAMGHDLIDFIACFITWCSEVTCLSSEMIGCAVGGYFTWTGSFHVNNGALLSIDINNF